MSDSELSKRVSTALCMALPVLILLLSGTFFSEARMGLMGVGYLLLGLAAFEFSSVCNSSGDYLRKSVYFLSCLICPTIALFLGFFALNDTSAILLFLGPALLYGAFLSFLLFSVYLFVIGRDAAMAPRELAQDIFIGIFLVGVCGSCLISLAVSPSGIASLTWLLLVVVANDVGAYFIGKALGGVKLAPYLSPKKTVSGSLGGLGSGVVVGLIAAMLLPGPAHWLQALTLAVLVGIAAQSGDLVKSYVKRMHDVKDMGTILPGHGGVLDRIDGLLCAAPTLYFILVVNSF